MYADADKAKQAAQALEAEYAQKLSNATQTSQRMMKDALQRGQAREEEIVRQANAEADAIRMKAVSDIAQEKKKALNDAKNEISGMAVAIAEKVVGRELNVQDQDRLVDEHHIRRAFIRNGQLAAVLLPEGERGGIKSLRIKVRIFPDQVIQRAQGPNLRKSPEVIARHKKEIRGAALHDLFRQPL